MAKNQAIVIGINQYHFLQPLKYAKRDAEAMQDFLLKYAGFERIFFFTDDSESIGGKSTKPFRANLLRVMRQLFEYPFMGKGDNFWFFFSGHGIPYANKDYLMPIDGDPEDIENTGIATRDISDRLRRCGADNVVMILDACRSEGKKSGLGIGQQTEKEAKRTGVISFFSCSPNQYSYEIDTLQQGVFTTALLEGLGVRGRCATVERLNQYLEYRVPELLQNRSLHQTPYVIAEPINRSHLILMPQYASLAEVAVLKNDAYQAEVNRKLDLAEQLWIRVLAAASGYDMEAIEAIQRIGIAKLQVRQAQPNEIPKSDFEGEVGKKSATDTASQTNETQQQTQSPSSQPEIQPVRGEDLRLDLKLSLQEAALGGDKKIKVPQWEVCDACKKPEFKKNWLGKCSKCGGEGYLTETRKLKVTIPPGVNNEVRLRVSGEGDAGRNGGDRGDLYIYLFVDEDKELKRDNLNILSTLKITESQAAAGCKIKIRTLDGYVDLKIPQGTRNGATLRLKNRGVPQIENPDTRGNHLVKILVKDI
ncbi:MAG: DnaJ C-terminal domain-containing protein [Cyanobacteria bacterium J06621_8]